MASNSTLEADDTLSILCVHIVELPSLPITSYVNMFVKYTRGLNVHLSVVSVGKHSLSKPVEMCI